VLYIAIRIKFIRKPNRLNRVIAAFIIALFLLFGTQQVQAQDFSNLRVKRIAVSTQPQTLDSLSVVPGTLKVFDDAGMVDSLNYQFNPAIGTFLWLGELSVDSVNVSYRTFPLSWTETHYHKTMEQVEQLEVIGYNPFVYQPNAKTDTDDVFSMGGLEKSGSISRGIGFGNNQDLSVNSSLNLSVAGRLTDNISILASVTDNNIPIQPEGNTAQLQDFDQVFIQIYDDNNKLTAGDLQLKRPEGYFMNYFKRVQGASFETQQKFDGKKDLNQKTNLAYLQGSASVSKGKFARNSILGVEGNQGPYRLNGADGETFIIVLAGTEQVYIDGVLLKRGQENDYIIDYNSAELFFTPNQLITKDKRIIVEFQYSERNYSRTMLQLASGIKTEKFDLRFNVFSEQDGKNQPFQQDLEPADRAFLASIGNDIQSAIVPAIDSVPFTNDQVLYQLTDSLGYDSVFVYSTNSENAFYRLSFSRVGVGNGDYVQEGFAASGRVFKWIAPDTVGTFIIKRGDHDPVVLLVTPKKQQMLSLGGTVKLKEETTLDIELALSNRDLNTFSTIDNDQNTGYAARVLWKNKNNLQPEKKQPLYVNTNVWYEMVETNFTQVERFRSIEFDRDWNLQGQTFKGTQQNVTGGVGFEKRGVFNVDYSLGCYTSGNNFEGIKNSLKGNLDHKKWFADFQGSILNSTGDEKTNFERHISQLSKTFKWFKVGYNDQREKNTFKDPTGDTLASRSYSFYEWEAYVSNPDTTKLEYKVFYFQRSDQRALENKLVNSEFAENYGIELGLVKDPRHQLRTRIVNRQMRVINETIAISQPENTLVGNLTYDMRVFKGALTMNWYYEIGSGLERAREFIYVFDPTAQGPYTWIDYNENGIQELNEFELARPEDGTRYLRIFTPTDNYIRAFTNQYSQTVNWNPAALWGGRKGILKLASRFANQVAFRIDRKTNREDGPDRFNPFVGGVEDTTLISSNSSIRNTLFFNRSHNKYGVDYTFGRNSGKSLLTNGFDSRLTILHQLKIRYNISRTFGIVLNGETGDKNNLSDFLDGRNYAINYYEVKPALSYQPNTSFRATLTTRYSEKNNSEDLGGEKAIVQDYGLEVRYNQVSKGSLLANLNFVNIRFDGVGNSSLTYEMLEGLRTGQNFTWGISYQRNIAKNVQMNLTYNGRKSAQINAVHNGGIQVRAFF
jgi:hypothetical protein